MEKSLKSLITFGTQNYWKYSDYSGKNIEHLKKILAVYKKIKGKILFGSATDFARSSKNLRKLSFNLHFSKQDLDRIFNSKRKYLSLKQEFKKTFKLKKNFELTHDNLWLYFSGLDFIEQVKFLETFAKMMEDNEELNNIIERNYNRGKFIIS